MLCGFSNASMCGYSYETELTDMLAVKFIVAFKLHLYSKTGKLTY